MENGPKIKEAKPSSDAYHKLRKNPSSVIMEEATQIEDRFIPLFFKVVSTLMIAASAYAYISWKARAASVDIIMHIEIDNIFSKLDPNSYHKLV